MNDRIGEIFSKAVMAEFERRLKDALTEEEEQRARDLLDDKNLMEALEESLKSYSEVIIQDLQAGMHERNIDFSSAESEFLSRMHREWWPAFVTSESHFCMILEAVEDYTAWVAALPDEKKEAKRYTYIAMQHIHGRILQQYLEDITLMKNGFADGAYARWRSMYELVIIASFISENDENTAKAFIEAGESEDKYDWALASGKFEGKRKLSFGDIRKKTDINTKQWTGQYHLATLVTHPSAQATFARMGNYGEMNCVPVGRSDYGITTPAEHAAISVAQVTQMFLSIFPGGDFLLRARVVTDWIDVIREAYFKVHDDLFPDDEPLYEKYQQLKLGKKNRAD